MASYLAMLRLEYAGQSYSKTRFRRELLTKLSERTEASVEMKYRNVSAVMIELGFLPIRGYKPLNNYQAVLVEEVLAQVANDAALDAAAAASVELSAEPPPTFELPGILVAPPKPTVRTTEQVIQSRITPFRRDYVEREARNRKLGLAGEIFVLEYETRRLHALGKKKLADRVEHVSQTRGDGLGYDVKSFEEDGRESFVEVKTTANSMLTPFYISAGEIRFSQDNADQFRLARVFDFREKPRMYIVPGPVEAQFTLNPVTYRASR